MKIRSPRLPHTSPFRISTRAAIALTIAAVITLESALFTREYFAAARFLKQNDPRKSGNLTGTLVFARPKLYRRGQQVRPEHLIEHLIRIGYRKSELNEAGTFQVSGKTLRINSRLPEFPGAALTFEGGRIAAISVDSRPADEVEVEPETLIAFMRMVRDERARKMNVRRIVLAASAFIPSPLYDAVLASEDKRFESSSGIDEFGIARSGLKWVSGGFSSTASGSGITQQLIKNVVLENSDKTFGRKSREIFLSLAATRMMKKQEIFAAYANNVYLGHVENGPALMGFEAAAQEFFGAGVRNITVGQSASLAAMLDRPEIYLRAAHNNDYTLLLARRDRVLSLMQRNYPDRYSAETIAQAKAEPLQFVFASEREPEHSLDLVSKQFENFAASELADTLGQNSATGNLHIFTTIDPELQIAAYKAVNDQLSRLDSMVARARRSLPTEQRGDEPIQVALVAMDAQTGEILAMAGGRNSEFNYATAKRSPGSAIKPFVYLQAVSKGTHKGEPFTAATIINPKTDDVDNYRPSAHVGGPATARALLARSDNGAAVATAHDAGLASVREFIRKATGSYSEELTGMLAISGSAGTEASVLAMCEGYSLFPNNGIKVSHTPFVAVFRDGVRLDLPRTTSMRIAEPGPAYIVTQMMRSVLRPGGTLSGALGLAGLPSEAAISAKSGTGSVADCYVAGFSKRLVVAVWVGMPNNKPALRMEQGFQGATTAMPIWSSFIRAVKQHRSDLLEGDFEMPANVRALKIDPKRGCVTDGRGVEEYFVAGREPRRCSE